MPCNLPPSISESRIKEAILELGRTGCRGNLRDYCSWLRFTLQQEFHEKSVQDVLNKLVSERIFKIIADFGEEYSWASRPIFPEMVGYAVSGNLADSPIQMFRSRLIAYLQFHGADDNIVMDLSIAGIEALENAVKYTDQNEIEVNYSIHDDIFYLEIVNHVRRASAEEDILSGKYSGSVTLMRGMMVMVKLFDDIQIDMNEEENMAFFRAEKKLILHRH